MSRPDPGAVLRFAGQVLFFSGPGGSYTAFFSVPKLELLVGQDLEVELLDFDLVHHDYLGQFGTPFDGLLPLSIQHSEREHRLDCRFLNASGIAMRIKPLLQKAKRAVSAVRRVEPNLRDPELGYARTGLRAAWAKLDAVAAYSGWGEQQLEGLAERLEAGDRAWFVAAESRVAERLAKLPAAPGAKVKAHGIRAWDPKVECKAGATVSSCEIQVQVVRRAKSLPQGIKLIDAQGLEYALAPQTQALAPEADTPRGFVRERWTISIPPGTPVGDYPGPPGANPGSRAKVLQLCRQRPTCWLRLD